MNPLDQKTFDPNRPDFKPYGLTCERWTFSPMARPDRHNEVELNLIVKGSLTYLFGGARATIPAGGLAAFWAAIPHQVISTPSADTTAEYFVVTIPLVWVLKLGLPDRLVQPILHGQMVHDPDDDHFDPDCQRFERWVDDLADRDEERHRAARLEIEARLLRLALALPPVRAGRRHSRSHKSVLAKHGLTKAEHMAAFIVQHYTQPLLVEDISRSVGLHPGYAMTLFQKTFGMTMIEFASQHRITHAQRPLATTDKKVLSIAFESGFGSLSRFNDAFRRACGCTPRQHRKRHQGT
jgi:AraC family transcriptional regulator, melibiose operon regulatory protein